MAAVQRQLANAAPAEKLLTMLKNDGFVSHEDGVVRFKADMLQNLPKE